MKNIKIILKFSLFVFFIIVLPYIFSNFMIYLKINKTMTNIRVLIKMGRIYIFF
jgi:hypothetical protein